MSRRQDKFIVLNMGSFKEYSEQLWKLERKEDLFEWKIKDVYIWNLLRMPIFSKVISEKEYSGSIAHPSLKKTKTQELVRRIKQSFLILRKSCIVGNDEYDYLIFESGRKNLIYQNQNVCQYSHYLAEELRAKGNKVLLIESPPYSSRDVAKKEIYRLRSILYAIFISRTISKDARNRIQRIEKEINDTFGVSISLFRTIRKKIFYFTQEYSQYRFLLNKRKPKGVFCIATYGSLMPLAAACKTNNIELTELQHGTITRYHMGYSFPNTKKSPYFPDRMFLWGRYWLDSNPYFPLKEDKALFRGNIYLHQNGIKFKESVSKKKVITIISEGRFSENLINIGKRLAKDFKEYQIYYKLHPGEFVNLNRYNELLDSHFNFSTISSERELYDLLAESEYVVGVASTVMFEAIYFNCKLICVKLTGYEYMEYLISEGIPLVENAEEAVKVIKEKNIVQLDPSYFFGNSN